MIRSIFIATLPILISIVSVLGVIVWNIIEIKSFRIEVNKKLDDLTKKVGELAERISKIEGRIEGKHLVIE